MIIGRDAELEAVATLISAAREGHGGSLMIRGDPGIGKSAILAQARETTGVQVLAARGAESEAHLAFAALRDLLRPLIDRRDRLAAAQRVALEAALALGPPTVPDRFAAYAGAFALVEAAGAELPTLLVIDDAHWLDAPSAEAIAFIARRLEDVAAAAVLAMRPGEGNEIVVGGAIEVALAPLSAGDSRALVVGRSPEMPPHVLDAVLTVAQGNPLALIELPRALSAEQRAGRAPLPEPLRAGEAIARAFRSRIEGLEPEVRAALVVIAAAMDDPIEQILDACHRVGASQAAVERAEAARVVRVEPRRVSLSHPLIRSIVLGLAGPAELRRAHAALAEGPAAEQEPERRAWHLAEAAIGPDEVVATALDEVGGAAAARTAYAAGADAFARAAELTPDPDRRARRLLHGAGLAHLAGRFPLSAGLLEQAAAVVQDPGIGAEIDHLRGMLRIYSGPIDEGIRLLFDSADAVARHSPSRAAAMLVNSSMAWGMAGQPEMCIVACRKAQLIGGLDGTGLAKLELAMANSLFFVGRGGEVRGRAGELEALSASLDPLSRDHHGVVCGIIVQMYCGDLVAAQREVERAVSACRRAAALGPLAFFLATGADVAFRTLHWAEGSAAAKEATDLALETDQMPIAAYALTVRARFEGAMGLEHEARAHLERARPMVAHSSTDALQVWACHALGLLELSRGDHGAAIAALEAVASAWEAHRVHCAEAVPWEHDLIEVYARAGRIADARRRLRILVEEAHGSTGPQVLALACRCRALIDPDYERHFDEALAHHARMSIPFDEARTRLLYGERLRRDRRRGRAREQLERSLATFEALGAVPWADRARGELAATGANLTAPQAAPMARLTPRELQVALAVADGATNREAGRSLFMSEKTVERHLSSTYAKLGLRSRSELARLLARHEGTAVA